MTFSRGDFLGIQRIRPEFPLRGFVRCALCQRPLTGSPSTGRMGIKYLYYRCQNKSCPSPVNVRAEVLHKQFIAFLRQQQPEPAFLKLFHAVIISVWNAKQADSVRLGRRLEEKIEELQERKRKLLEAYVYQQKLERSDYE